MILTIGCASFPEISFDTAVGIDCRDAIWSLYCFKFFYQLNSDLYEAMGNTNITTSTNKESSLASSSAYPSQNRQLHELLPNHQWHPPRPNILKAQFLIQAQSFGTRFRLHR